MTTRGKWRKQIMNKHAHTVWLVQGHFLRTVHVHLWGQSAANPIYLFIHFTIILEKAFGDVQINWRCDKMSAHADDDDRHSNSLTDAVITTFIQLFKWNLRQHNAEWKQWRREMYRWKILVQHELPMQLTTKFNPSDEVCFRLWQTKLQNSYR